METPSAESLPLTKNVLDAGVVLAAEKKEFSALFVPMRESGKLYKMDDHILVSVSGVVMWTVSEAGVMSQATPRSMASTTAGAPSRTAYSPTSTSFPGAKTVWDGSDKPGSTTHAKGLCGDTSPLDGGHDSAQALFILTDA